MPALPPSRFVRTPTRPPLEGMALAEGQAVHLFSVVNYDPSGSWIAREFAAQLQAFGVREVTVHPLIRPDRLAAEQVALGRYALPTGSKTTNWVRETGGIEGEPSGLKRMPSPQTSSGPPLSRQPRRTCARSALLEEAARRRLDALPFEAVVAQIAAMAARELRALARHLRPRLVPGEAAPAPEVAECSVQMSAAELRELVQRLRARLAAKA